MKIIKKYLRLANISQTILTFWLTYATMILRYTGIVVYFVGQKSYTHNGEEARQNKKQKQPYQLPAGVNHPGSSVSTAAIKAEEIICPSFGLIQTFCFLCERFFASNVSTTKSRHYTSQIAAIFTAAIKIKTKRNACHDSRLLSATRHLARNRSQQNHADSLGRRGIDSQSSPRQSGLALLFQRSSGRNYPLGSRYQLLPRRTRTIFNRFKKSCSTEQWFSIWRVTFLNLFNCSYDLANANNLLKYSLSSLLTNFSVIQSYRAFITIPIFKKS